MGEARSYQLGLLGFPVAQSLSPTLHRAALQHFGLSGSYHLFSIPPLPEEKYKLVDLVEKLRAGILDGLNVTIPHKQNVIPFLDELSGVAQAIGAVNTISRYGNKLIGDNTDAPGFLIDLKKFLGSTPIEVKGKQALVLGAGGSARAVCYALKQDGWKVAIASRRKEQGEQLCRDLSVQGAISLSKKEMAHIHPDLIVNTTPVGMHPKGDASPWPSGLPFPEKAVIYDLVYIPATTKLIQQARTHGLPATNGLGMLIEQARLSFQIWTGQSIDCEVMLSAIQPTLSKEIA